MNRAKLRLKNRQFNNRGYALVTAMVIGSLSMALMLAVAAFLHNSALSESARRHKSEIRNAAESGMEYALANYGNSNGANFTLPGSMFAGAIGTDSNNSVLSQLSVSVTIRPYTVGEMNQFSQWSPLYSTAIDPTRPNSILYDRTNPGGSTTAWRVIESKASMGGISKTIRVIAEPMYEVTPESTGLTSSDSYFKNGAFGDQSLALAGSNNVSWLGKTPVDSGQFKLRIASNGNIILGPEAVVQGNVLQSGSVTGSYSASPRSFLFGNLTSNSDSASLASAVDFAEGATPPNNPNAVPFYTNTTVNPPGNVFNGAENSFTFNSDGSIASFDYNATNSGAPITSDAGVNTTTVPPVPSGRGAENFPSLSELASSGNQLTSVTGDWQTGSLTTNDLSNGQTVNLNDFLTSQNASGVENPTRIFVNDSDNASSSTRAVDIDGSKLLHSTDPSNLQIFYSGTKEINLTIPAGSEFAATIYAPNSKVNINGLGTFKGAVSGKETTFEQSLTAKLLSDFSDASAGPNADTGLKFTGANSTSPTVSGYRVVTWTELN